MESASMEEHAYVTEAHDPSQMNNNNHLFNYEVLNGSFTNSHPNSHSNSHPNSHSNSHPNSHNNSHPNSHDNSHDASFVGTDYGEEKLGFDGSADTSHSSLTGTLFFSRVHATL